PSLLSEWLLEREERLVAIAPAAMRNAVEEVRLRWQSQERLRQLAHKIQELIRPAAPVSTNLWFECTGQQWLAILDPDESRPMISTTGQAVTNTSELTDIRFYSESLIKQAMEIALKKVPVHAPPYFSFELALENRPILPEA